MRHRHRRTDRLDDPIDLFETDDDASFTDLELERAGDVRLERTDIHGGASSKRRATVILSAARGAPRASCSLSRACPTRTMRNCPALEFRWSGF
jgi:hypothetical protein